MTLDDDDDDDNIMIMTVMLMKQASSSISSTVTDLSGYRLPESLSFEVLVHGGS